MSTVSPIIIVGPAHPLRGGIARFNESLAIHLQRVGTPCTIVSYSKQYPSILFPGRTQYTDSPAPAGLVIRPLVSSINPLTWGSVAGTIAAMKPSVVVLRYWIPFMAPALGTIARLLSGKGVPCIGFVDNALPHEARPMDKALGRWFYRHCAAFAALSESVASDIHSLAPGKEVWVHPHPVYNSYGDAVPMAEARSRLGLEPDTPYILFFGFVRKYKGLDLLLEAMARQPLSHSDAKLIVAGEFYESKTPYLQMIDRLGLKERVVLHDRFIPDAEVRYYFSAANIVAQTYRSATQSGVTQIAYHMGRPMLVTNTGGLPEMVPHDLVGYVSEPTPDAIALWLGRFFSENREAAFSRAVLGRREMFSWEHFTERFLTFAHQIAARE